MCRGLSIEDGDNSETDGRPANTGLEVKLASRCLPPPRWRVAPGQNEPNASHLALVELLRLGKLRSLRVVETLHLIDFYGVGRSTTTGNACVTPA